MLDGEHVVVAEHAQRGDEFLPPLGAVAVAAGAEDPAAVGFVGVGLGVEHAGARQVGRVDLRVLGVDVEDGVLEHADGGDGIDVLPEHVAGIEIAADAGPGDGAQLEHGLRAVDDEAGMHLDGDLHAVVGGEFPVLAPVGSDDFVPLPVEDLEVVGRPRAGDPVGRGRVRGVAGASGEIDDDGDAELFGEQDRFATDFAVFLGARRVGMQRVAVAAERADADAVVFQDLLKFGEGAVDRRAW